MTFYIRHKNDELMHHGIKGQKWGIRRFQNPDGTLTSLGKQRYGTITDFKAAKPHVSMLERGYQHKEEIVGKRVKRNERRLQLSTDEAKSARYKARIEKGKAYLDNYASMAKNIILCPQLISNV